MRGFVLTFLVGERHHTFLSCSGSCVCVCTYIFAITCISELHCHKRPLPTLTLPPRSTGTDGQTLFFLPSLIPSPSPPPLLTHLPLTPHLKPPAKSVNPSLHLSLPPISTGTDGRSLLDNSEMFSKMRAVRGGTGRSTLKKEGENPSISGARTSEKLNPR